jgi:hypothetical protein
MLTKTVSGERDITEDDVDYSIVAQARLQCRDTVTKYYDAVEFIEAHGLEKEFQMWLLERYSEDD